MKATRNLQRESRLAAAIRRPALRLAGNHNQSSRASKATGLAQRLAQPAIRLAANHNQSVVR